MTSWKPLLALLNISMHCAYKLTFGCTMVTAVFIRDKLCWNMKALWEEMEVVNDTTLHLKWVVFNMIINKWTQELIKVCLLTHCMERDMGMHIFELSSQSIPACHSVQVFLERTPDINTDLRLQHSSQQHCWVHWKPMLLTSLLPLLSGDEWFLHSYRTDDVCRGYV